MEVYIMSDYNNKNARNNPGNQRQKGQHRDTPRKKQTTDVPPSLKSLFDEIAPAIKNYLNQSAASKVRVAEAREKSAQAVEKLMESLPGIVQQTVPARSIPRRRKINARKQEILDTINKLRDESMTYEEIADYLTKNNIPTFSGRGRWHAQTIHRLYMYPP